MYGQIERIDAAGIECDLKSAAAWPEGRARLLSEGEMVHRELRPSIGSYVEEISHILAEGANLTQLWSDDGVRAIALWRVFTTTYCGRRLEIDDLVTGAAYRSAGFGKTILGWLELRAINLGCSALTLNSALFRVDAHRFYEREGYSKFGIHFARELGGWPILPA